MSSLHSGCPIISYTIYSQLVSQFKESAELFIHRSILFLLPFKVHYSIINTPISGVCVENTVLKRNIPACPMRFEKIQFNHRNDVIL